MYPSYDMVERLDEQGAWLLRLKGSSVTCPGPLSLHPVLFSCRLQLQAQAMEEDPPWTTNSVVYAGVGHFLCGAQWTGFTSQHMRWNTCLPSCSLKNGGGGGEKAERMKR